MADSLLDFLNKGMDAILSSNAVAPAPEQNQTTQTTQTPVAAPAQPAIKPLPKVELPQNNAPVAQPEQPAQPEQAYTPPAPRVMQSTIQQQGTDEKTKQRLEMSGNESLQSANDYGKYLQDLGVAQGQAKQQIDKKLGTPEQQFAQLQANNQARMSEMRKQAQDLDNQIAELKNHQFKNYWADKSTESKIGMALGVALGQYGASLTGSKNVAWDILQNAMDNDMKLQQMNYDAKLKNIQNTQLSIDQKSKLINAANQQFEMYKIGRTFAIEDAAERMMQKMGNQMTPALADAKYRLEQSKEATYRDVISKMATQTAESTTAAVPKAEYTPEWASSQAKDPTTKLGAYNTAMRDYKLVKDFVDTGNGKAATIKLIADKLKQGSYDPSKFDPSVRNIAQKLKDYGIEKAGLGDAEELTLIKNAEKLFEADAITRYQETKDQFPLMRNLSLQFSASHGTPTDSTFIESLDKRLVPKVQQKSFDPTKLGAKPIDVPK
jgi:hypothetical protein